MFRNRRDLDRYRQTQADLLFEWRLPERRLLAAGRDGSISLQDGPLADALQSYWMAPHSAEWVNFTRAMASSGPIEMISSFGFLRLGNRETSADWADMLHVLNTARGPWGDLKPQTLSARERAFGTLPSPQVFGSNEGAISDASALLRERIQQAIADGGVVVNVQDDLVIRVRPTDLRSFMLLDAAEAISTKAEYLTCSHCQNLFRQPDRRRRAYCSLQCRHSDSQKNYRVRQKEKAKPVNHPQATEKSERNSDG